MKELVGSAHSKISGAIQLQKKLNKLVFYPVVCCLFTKAEENGMYSALRILPSLLKNILHNSLFLLILTSKSKQNELIQACIRSKCRGLELIDIYISI